MMMDTDMARKFGQMESRLDSMETAVEDIKAQNLRMEVKLDLVVQKLASASGGTKMLITLLTLSGAVGFIMSKAWDMVIR